MTTSPSELSWTAKKVNKIDVVDGDSAMWLENELCDGWGGMDLRKSTSSSVSKCPKTQQALIMLILFNCSNRIACHRE